MRSGLATQDSRGLARHEPSEMEAKAEQASENVEPPILERPSVPAM